MKLLIINPGATSTKIAVFEDEEQLFKVTIDHSAEELDRFPGSSTRRTTARRPFSRPSPRPVISCPTLPPSAAAAVCTGPFPPAPMLSTTRSWPT